MEHFRILKKTRLEELKADLIEGVHIQTDARFMHIANDDPENLFCLSFKTIPETSNGVAHILEHTVLCGSEKYPIKDPFFSMTRRSLNTFMNALTGPDFTCYPAATKHEKDFYNLLEVYMDSVFHPLLTRWSFLQEGIRLEFKNPTDPTSPLQYKGIVFNEMKGELSSASSRLIERINKELYPSNTYGVNSGGDPKEIPLLTYEELKAFHEKFYHPSQCLFYFYGNMPLEKHLEFIHEKLLKGVAPRPHIPEISPIKRFTKPKRIEDFYPFPAAQSFENKYMVSFGWLTTSILDTLDTQAFTTLVYYLVGNDSSVLKRAILDSKLCKEVTISYDNEITDIPFILLLRGCTKGVEEELEKVIFETLKKVVQEGIPSDQIESVLHQKEFSRSEIKGSRYPFGLTLFMRSALLEQHGVDPEEGLLVHRIFDRLRAKMASEPDYLTSLIQKYLIDNPHWVRLVMVPSHDLELKESIEERASLIEIEKGLTERAKQKIIEETEGLARFQESQSEQDLDLLPKVTLEDVPAETLDLELSQGQMKGLRVFSHACFTNEIVYADVVYDLPVLSAEQLPYFRLMSHLLPQLGAGRRNYLETLEAEQRHTGGIWAAVSFNQNINEPETFTPSLVLKGKALYRKKEEFFSLLKEKTFHIDFDDRERVKELLKKHYSTLSNALQKNALSYAISLSSSSLSPSNKANEEWFGFSYYQFIKENYEKVDEVIEQLKIIYEKIFNYASPDVVITADANFIQEGFKTGFWGLSDLPSRHETAKPWSLPLDQVEPQGKVMSSQVAFNATTFKTVPYTHPDAAAVSLAAHLFDNLVLHTKVREQGGAYGCGASYNSGSAYFCFYSSRDPHVASTFGAFEEALKMVSEGRFEEEDLIEAKLEILQGLDAPVSPGSKGELAYGWWRDGETLETRQEYRSKVLSVTKEQVIRATQEHLLKNYPSAIPVVFAGIELLEKEGPLLSRPLTLHTV